MLSLGSPTYCVVPGSTERYVVPFSSNLRPPVNLTFFSSINGRIGSDYMAMVSVKGKAKTFYYMLNSPRSVSNPVSYEYGETGFL